MRRFKEVFVVLTLALIMCSCGSLATSGNKLMQVQKNMTQKEVISILGQPDYRRFDQNREQWEYRKLDVFSGKSSVILVDFENDRVVLLDSFEDPSYQEPPVSVHPPLEVRPVNPPYPNHKIPFLKPMSREDFKAFYNKVKNKPFKDDQLELIEIGATNNYFTCQQCIQLMSIYTFDDDKLKVLNLLAGHIVDPQNQDEIINALDFLSSKDKAKEILRRRQKAI